MSTDYILLKWGTLKGWDVSSNPEAIKLLKQYLELGSSASAMYQRDTPEQKKILCDLFRIHTGKITNDWSGDQYTVEEAIEYVMDYRN